MSEIRVNISDASETIHGDLHGSYTDALVAALAAEPETIEEYKHALSRFVKETDGWTPLKMFRHGEDLEPWDAGILAIDLPSRVIGCESTYTYASAEGSVRVEAEFSDFDDDNDGYVHVPYRLPDDWLIINSIPFFEGTSSVRRRSTARYRTGRSYGAARFVLQPLLQTGRS